MTYSAFAFLMDAVAFVLLLGAAVFVTRFRRPFPSFRPLAPALTLIAGGRVAEMLMEHPIAGFYGFSETRYFEALSIAGNLVDVLGFVALVYAFYRMAHARERVEKELHQFSSLLPMCAGCKHVKVTGGTWVPIEVYLKQESAQTVTHGLCPDCRERIYGPVLRSRRENQ